MTAITGVIQQSVSAIKRELGAHRGIVKKATGYSYTVVQRLIQLEVEPFQEELYKVDASILGLYFML